MQYYVDLCSPQSEGAMAMWLCCAPSAHWMRQCGGACRRQGMRVGHLLSQLLAVPTGAPGAPAKRAPLFADQPLSLLPDELWHPSAAALAPPATASAADPSPAAAAAGDAPAAAQAAAQAGKPAAGAQGLEQHPSGAAEGGKDGAAGWDSDQESDSDDDSLQVFNLTEEPEDCESGSCHLGVLWWDVGLPGNGCLFLQLARDFSLDVLLLRSARLPVLA